jgi:predicted metal-dependent peptidase
VNADKDVSTDRAFSLARKIYECDGEPQSGFGFDGNDLQGDGEQTPMDNDNKAKAISESIKQKMISNIVSAKMRGAGTDGLAEVFEKLYMRNEVAWGKVIRNALLKGLRRDINYNQPHKKTIASGFRFYIPAFNSVPKEYKIAVAIDTSGSMGCEELQSIAEEIVGLQKHYPVSIDLFMCDYRLQKKVFDIDSSSQLMREIKNMYGRCGTSYRPVFREIAKLRKKRDRRYKTLVYFTDGDGDQDEIKPIRGLKTFWIATDAGAKFPFGTVFKIKI